MLMYMLEQRWEILAQMVHGLIYLACWSEVIEASNIQALEIKSSKTISEIVKEWSGKIRK